jgi:hypothetical protein
MANDMLSTPYISMFDKAPKPKGRKRIHAEEDLKQNGNRASLDYYYKNRDEQLNKRIEYYNKNKDKILEHKRQYYIKKKSEKNKVDQVDNLNKLD